MGAGVRMAYAVSYAYGQLGYKCFSSGACSQAIHFSARTKRKRQPWAAIALSFLLWAAHGLRGVPLHPTFEHPTSL
jgi:hypothetical protein